MDDAETIRYKQALERIAEDRAGCFMPRVDRQYGTCREENPDDPEDWCLICIAREALKPVPEIKPTQHCTNENCTYTMMSHTAQWCGTEQSRRCECAWCYTSYE